MVCVVMVEDVVGILVWFGVMGFYEVEFVGYFGFDLVVV